MTKEAPSEKDRLKDLQRIYLQYGQKAIFLADLNVYDVDSEIPFSFDQHPATKHKSNKLFELFSASLFALIAAGIKVNWNAAENRNDRIAEDFLQAAGKKRNDYPEYFSRNQQVYEAFQKRKVAGLNLSDRVWRCSTQFKAEMEMIIDLGLLNGQSAASMSRDLRQYLQNPDMLFRRVRDKRGNLGLSQRAKQYHPGQGVYRSSYKNAYRLATSEINMAYRTADFLRIQKLDFVVGYQVHRSNHVFACALCDSLAGKYPKTFLFRLWHPLCRCYTTDILSTTEEFIEREKASMEGKDPGPLKSVNEVKNIPEGFKTWVSDHAKQIRRAKSEPFFIQDNKQFVKDLIK
jgi:hypothetical protein